MEPESPLPWKKELYFCALRKGSNGLFFLRSRLSLDFAPLCFYHFTIPKSTHTNAIKIKSNQSNQLARLGNEIYIVDRVSKGVSCSIRGERFLFLLVS